MGVPTIASVMKAGGKKVSQGFWPRFLKKKGGLGVILFIEGDGLELV